MPVLWCYPWTLSVLWPSNGLLLLRLSRFVCSLNLRLSALLVSPMYAAAVVVTRDVVDGSTLVFFRCTTFKRRVLDC